MAALAGAMVLAGPDLVAQACAPVADGTPGEQPTRTGPKNPAPYVPKRARFKCPCGVLTNDERGCRKHRGQVKPAGAVAGLAGFVRQ